MKIRIKRGNKIESYEVPEGLTVLEALEYINKKYNANILFRYGCRNGQCGSCALTIDNEPRLACITKVKDNMLIEPLKGFKVIKDLIVDREVYNKKLLSIKNYVVRRKYPEGLENINEDDVEKTKELRACIDCLSCLSQCPARDFNYSGATIMRQLLRFAYDVRDEEDRERIAFFENIYNCTTCAKCVEVCPQEINLVKAIENLRELCFKKGYYLDEHLKVRENILKGNRSVVKEGASLLDEIEEEYLVKDEDLRVAFFTGCLIDYRLKDVGKDTIKVLNHYNISVIIPKDQVCCGSPMFRTGQRDLAEKLKEKNIEVFEKLDVDYIITVCAGCGATLKKDYGLKNVRDITEIIYKKVKENRKNIKVTYHDPCHLLRGQGIYKEPREILKKTSNFIDLKACCCGAGGGLRSGRREIADAIGMRRAKMIYNTDAEIVVTVCPFCEYHLRECLEKYKNINKIDKEIKVMNIATFLSKYHL
ncbi:succinate dehydrogenase/fumarate reductase iron-sulfur subunit [Methanocaldococcus villosus KIN24-T80]|uniref:Succinate dehydrogenase/fumarate reductase iron-sulfur subunit n=1 Tax=Methanocaldococcus villosus KIN24-T80 TaxID=1069083 RepID=N6UV81_9EURY|nr:succinate dehydrogenase/fumarate reductase iron-sulfur subunit [Methanocaldococcus villosus KIN24-T80]